VDAVDILDLLDQLKDELEAGRKMPIGGGVVVDRRRMADLIEELRLAIPTNVRQARGILERGEQTIEEARQEAARIIAAAEREAAERVAESEITRRAREEAHSLEVSAQESAARTTRLAQEQAQQIVAEAERLSQQQRREADEYVVALLTQLQRLLGSFLGNVRQSLDAFPEYREESRE
jgi:cell division septum initiation protein DivIVA